MSEPKAFSVPNDVPKGLICMTTHGSVTLESCDAWSASRSLFAGYGIKQVAFAMMHGSLVDKARNEVVIQALSDPANQFVLFIDADMHWAPEAPLRLIERAYNSLPIADIMGAWCPLRGWPYLPTIDPGSGTWEPIPPGSGVVEVMRTGAAFVLVKRHVFEKMTPPWYHVHFAPDALSAMQGVETFALTKFDGRNPLRLTPEWQLLEKCALEERIAQGPQVAYPYTHTGEDSTFVDKARALGFRAFVETDVEISHIDRMRIDGKKHIEAMAELRVREAAASGVLEA